MTTNKFAATYSSSGDNFTSISCIKHYFSTRILGATTGPIHTYIQTDSHENIVLRILCSVWAPSKNSGEFQFYNKHSKCVEVCEEKKNVGEQGILCLVLLFLSGLGRKVYATC